MEAPPFAAPPTAPQRRRSPWLIVAIVAAALCLCSCPIGTAILYPVFLQAKVAAKKTACMTNVKQLGLRLLMYAGDNNEVLPKADVWMDQVLPFGVSEDDLTCPSVTEARFGYAMNSQLSQADLVELKSPEEQILLFEVEPGVKNANGGPETMLETPRHGTNVVAFADGHTVARSREQG